MPRSAGCADYFVPPCPSTCEDRLLDVLVLWNLFLVARLRYRTMKSLF